MITVIIATLNRPDQLKYCIKSILKNNFKNFEILVLDQSNKDISKKITNSFNDVRIKHLFCKYANKSKAINLGIHFAKGDILAFTDDDCVVSVDWLLNIYNSFQKYKGITMLFGKSLPYLKSNNLGMHCPSTFQLNSRHFIYKPCYHAQFIGFGNNMSIRKSFFDHNNDFSIWLGPGSIGLAAEDAEIALRCLIMGNKIRYDSSILIYHNKWLTLNRLKKESYGYLCGEMACYGYLYFQNYNFAKIIISRNFVTELSKLKNILKNIVYLNWRKDLVFEITTLLMETYFLLRGFLIGFFRSMVAPINLH